MKRWSNGTPLSFLTYGESLLGCPPHDVEEEQMMAHLDLESTLGPAAVLVTAGRAPAPTSVRVTVARHGLTPAETYVLTLLAGGLSNREIARRLRISVITVKTHVRHVLRKLGVES